MVLNGQWQIFHAFSDWEHISDEWTLLLLDRQATVPAQESNSPQEDMPLDPDTFFWLWADQSLLLLLNALCLAEKQQIPILMSLVWHSQGLNPRPATLKARTLTITPLRQLKNLWLVVQFPCISLAD